MSVCVLGIETSCDETAASVVQGGRVISNIVSSSVALHREFGGVIPEVASRFHIEYLNRVVEKALKKSKKSLKKLDAIAVTHKPGLPGSLLVGTSFARALSYALGIPLISVDHLTAHVYANFLDKRNAVKFPFIGAVVSGGHTSIFVFKSLAEYTLIGRTRDDAIGEAFDKVAKILNLGYPGGPAIEKMARKYKLNSRKKPIKFPMALLGDDNYDFSLSGIKTAVLEYARNGRSVKKDLPRVSWSFQESVFDVFAKKIIDACKEFDMRRIVLGGGVVSNKRLCDKIAVHSKRLGFEFFYPKPALCIDNAAMVAGLGEELLQEKEGSIL
ncbi:MAG: tRNA (adenosine(37)-N6)-threonylcarbamoyltransferase complex transferase subunit TsaD [Candidatus Omnitrophica bacterium]|nr:tRNA (adenosine(37)-N6)-threonylcarbamoyltransferase complex transferase subunit TsaD [Candidatus Omnitrophota bacterium]